MSIRKARLFDSLTRAFAILVSLAASQAVKRYNFQYKKGPRTFAVPVLFKMERVMGIEPT
jgi:hypothetical protein